MPSRTLPKTVANLAQSWRPVTIRHSTFVEANQSDTIAIEPLDPVEVYRAEVGEDGVLSPFDYLWLGEPPRQDAKTNQGKWEGLFADTNGDVLPRGTEVRFARTLQTDSGTDPLTDWFDVTAVDEQDKEAKEILRPTTNEDGNPMLVTEGEIVVVELRNQSEKVTLDYNESNFTAPAISGA